MCDFMGGPYSRRRFSMGQNWTVGTFPLVNTILTIQLMSKRKILVHLYYCSAFFKCCKKDVQSIRISFTIIFLCLNRFSKNTLKSDFSEIRVRSWVQVVSRQRNRPLIGWSIWSNNFLCALLMPMRCASFLDFFFIG